MLSLRQAKSNEELLGLRERLGVVQAELKQQLHGGAQLQAQAEARKAQMVELKENAHQTRRVRARCRHACGSPLATTAWRLGLTLQTFQPLQTRTAAH